MVRATFRKKLHLAKTRPKNTDASVFHLALKDEFEIEAKKEIAFAILKVAQKSLKTIQKNVVDTPVGARVDIKLQDIAMNDTASDILARTIIQCKNIRSICLVKCGLTSQGATALAKAASEYPILEEIDFSGNELHSPVVISMITTLADHPSINTLKFSENLLDDDCLPPLLELLSKKKVQFCLDLSKNTFSLTGLQSLIDVVSQNVFITKLNLDGTGITEDMQKNLSNLLGRNDAVTGVIEKMIGNACRRTFKTKLVNFRQSVQQNRGGEDSNANSNEPVYKMLQKGKATNSVNLNTTSKRFNIGYCLDVGRRHEMQDVVCVKGSFMNHDDYDFIALFDGHGGREAATYCSERLHIILSELIEKDQDHIKALNETFGRLTKEMEAWSTMTGTTAVVVLMIGEKRYIANLGDSGAVLCKKGIAVFKTKDHKPTDPKEVERITNLGGSVKDGRVQGQLSVSRALGDSNLAPFISSVPDIYIQELSPQDDFMVLASDGIWDVLNKDDIVKIVFNKKAVTPTNVPEVGDHKSESELIAEMIKNEAYRKGSKDNMSVIVILFNGFGKSHSRYRRRKMEMESLVSGTTPSLKKSTSIESQMSIMELDPLYTTSDSELPTLQSESEDDDDLGGKTVKESVDDTFLEKIKKKELTSFPL